MTDHLTIDGVELHTAPRSVTHMPLTTTEGTTTMTKLLDPDDPTGLSDEEAVYLATRPTKAMVVELLNELREANAARAAEYNARRDMKEARDEAVADRDRWRTAHLPDPEAQALSGCVRAIEALVNPPNRSNAGALYATPSYGYTHQPDAEGMQVGRILLALAARYGVPVIPKPEPERTGPSLAVIPPELADAFRQLIEQEGWHR